MNRRDLLANLGKAGIGLAGAAALAEMWHGRRAGRGTGASPGVVHAAEQKPNIIYILADDLGYGDLGCYGQKKFATPNIDSLAAEGMRFTDHYSGSTVCAPSRCVLLTGYHTGHAYIRGNRRHKPVGQEPIPRDTVTVAKLLKRAGYATGAFGKWGLGFPGSAGDPVDQGFDEFFGYNCQRNAHTYYPRVLYHNRERVQLDGKTYSHDLIVKRALEWIRANAKRPFFCYLPVTIPHAAMHVPEEYAAPFRKRFPQFENRIGRYAGPQIRNPAAMFAGMITKLDEDVGRVLALLKELGIDENTVVMFTSDNGPHREGGHMPDFFDSNGPLRGIKRDLYEGGIRVPMLARWPGRIEAGAETDHISAFWDFLPTACEIAGAEPPADIDGISFVPTLLGKRERQRRHEYLYWEFTERGGAQAVRKGKWKAVRPGAKRSGPDGPIELYNLETDLGERTNVASTHAAVIVEMSQTMKSARTESPLFRLFGAGGRKRIKKQ